jgi:putative transposase
MSDLYKNKYRISSARLQKWNYANEAMYFVTICTKGMECLFGEIVAQNQNETLYLSAVETPCMASLPNSMASLPNSMASLPNSMASLPNSMASLPNNIASLQPTKIGKIALNEWYKSVILRPDMNISLDEFTVMPNHIHGIICIGKNEFNSGVGSRDAMHGVSTEQHGVSTEQHGDNKVVDYKNKFGPQTKNLSSILRGYKSAVTTFAKKENIYFEWQERFHDHIIRSQEEYFKISNYIKNNPKSWLQDKFNPNNLKPSK